MDPCLCRERGSRLYNYTNAIAFTPPALRTSQLLSICAAAAAAVTKTTISPRSFNTAR